MTSKTGVLISFVFCVVQTSGLVELPQVDDNSILTTEAAIRNTINTLFVTLQLQDVRKKPRLKEYSIVHNHLVSVTLQDYKNLKEIAKLTRVDKKNTNNETESFMCALNDLLNEDIEVDHKDHISDTNDIKNDDVIKYIKQFLAHLESLKEEYGVNRESQRIKEDIYQTLNKYGNISFNYTKINTKLDKSEENDAVLDTNYYWKPELSGRRIYGGERVKIKYFPFMANVQIFNRFQCGGTILMSDLVVTASSCVQLAYNNRFFRENPAFLSVRVGSHYYDSGESIAVLEVYFHPYYNPKNLHNNICLMRLVRKINLKRKRVKKIDFDRNNSPLPMNTQGITIIGWGARGTSNIIQDELHNQLAFAVLDVYPLAECQEIYSEEYVTKKNFCAGFVSVGGGACNRDVGGPGIANGMLMGVVSFGSPICGTPDAPTVFTKIGYYTDWIEDIMDQHVPSGRQKTTLMFKRVITPPPKHLYEETTFKIPPLSGKPKPIPISEVEALRMLENSQLFSEFLETMFGSKENEEYQELLDYARESHLEKQNSTHTASPTTSKRIHSQTKSVSQSTGSLIKSRTPIGDVEPESERDRSVEEEEYDKEEGGELEEEEEEEGKFDVEFDVEDFKYPMHATKMISNAEPTSPPAGSLKMSKDTDLERDLVNLLDNIDLKQIINNMSSLEEDKLLDESKVRKLLKDKKVDSKMLDDESILTLLYLSDSEKKQESDKHVNVDKYDSTAEIEGLSIETGPFQDMTYRVGKNISVLKNLMEKEDFYDLLTDTVKN